MRRRGRRSGAGLGLLPSRPPRAHLHALEARQSTRSCSRKTLASAAGSPASGRRRTASSHGTPGRGRGQKSGGAGWGVGGGGAGAGGGAGQQGAAGARAGTGAGRGLSGAGRAVGAGGGRGGQDAAAQGAGGDAEGLEWEPPEAGRAGAQLRFATRRPAGRSVSVSPSGPCRNLARPHPSPAVGRPAAGRGARLLPHFCCSELLSELNFVLFSSWSCFLLSLPHISCPLTSQSSLVAGVWSVGWACI